MRSNAEIGLFGLRAAFAGGAAESFVAAEWGQVGL
jgi:hypothetical protein